MLDQSSVETITRAVRDANGREICGFLMNDDYENQQFVAARNSSGSPHSVLVSWDEFHRLQRLAEHKRLRLAAFIHSHETSLELSFEDRRGLKGSPMPWIIVVLDEAGLRYKVHMAEVSESGRGAEGENSQKGK